MDAISTETVRLWQKELTRLADEQRERLARMAELERKLAAAEVLGLTPKDEPTASHENSTDEGGDSDADATGLPSAIVRLLSEVEHGLKPPEIKRQLIAAGMDARRFGTNSSYFYTVLGRLTKRGALARRGKSYRIAK